MEYVKLAVAALIGAIVLGGCASSRSGAAYTRDQARHEMNVRMGVVESVRQVQIEGTKSGIGATAGGALGGLAGKDVGGRGKSGAAGTIIGAVAGGVAGAAVEEGATRKDGLEITVKLDNGHLIAVTQEADESFRPGDRVRILSGGGATRVTH